MDENLQRESPKWLMAIIIIAQQVQMPQGKSEINKNT